MKVIFGTAFIGLIAASIAVPECSNEKELVPNPYDCTSYYSCENGFLILKTCPGGLFFDKNTHTCVNPNEAVCDGPEEPSPPEPEEPSPPEPEEPSPPEPEEPSPPAQPTPPVKCPEQLSPEDNVLLPNPLDCGSFYQCVWGKPILQKCPRGMHYNNKKKWCDRPGAANCTVTP